GRPHLARPVCVRGQGAHATVLRLLGALLAERVPLDLARLFEDAPAPAPTAPRSAADAIVVPTAPAPLRLPPLPAARAIPPRAPRLELQRSVAVLPASPAKGPHLQQSVAVDLARFAAVDAARTASHAAFLRVSAGATAMMAEQLRFQIALLERFPGAAIAREAPIPASTPAVFLDRAGCLEFATGSIGRALGPAFARIDAHPTRVRLPDEPLMLVDRIISVTGEPLSMRPGAVVTEHDVHARRWYLDGGRIPTGVAVEAGQADLFLSGWLGIDRETRGEAVYRLLDAVVTFHAGLPRPGDVIRYAIEITELFRHGASWFFRFRFDATVRGAPLMSMREGLAGFFPAADLEAGRGVVRASLDERPRAGRRPADWRPIAPPTEGPESAEGEAFQALRHAAGLPGGAAGAAAGAARRHELDLLDRVLRLDLAGGRFGLGVVACEQEIRPDAWFLTCHFVDDRVMPGTLMYECCMHALRIFLARLGWSGAEAYEPVPGVASRLRCRGQVVERTRRVVYEVHVKELGYGPEPFAIADAAIHADGKAIVEITDMSVRLAGLDRAAVEARAAAAAPRRALYDRSRIVAFATGNPSEAFGEPYRVFDRDRVIARLPGDPYQFLDRIVRVTGRPFEFVAGGEVEAEVDVAPDAWFFAANRQDEIPFAVLLEIALQPCGWLAAYIGSALQSETDLHFRNLGGTGVLRRPVGRGCGTLTTRVKMTSLARSGDSIIQRYDFAVADAAGVVYEGDTYFGFFTDAALANQVGLRGAAFAGTPASPRPLPTDITQAPFPDERLRMIDAVTHLDPRGGPAGLGHIVGKKRVRADEWFFRAHFHQDPVWPGSLGLEAFLQLLKAFAVDRWGAGEGAASETMAPGRKHAWTYRGQVVPRDGEVTVEAIVTAVDDAARRVTAKGLLGVDGRVIYEMSDFTIGWRPPGA
ncbi:MAG TPA: type I polyketide synthase, partial [Planctomycetota bacterium]|nr:type I polyketide synthase [Planctomycetota bacterium]